MMYKIQLELNGAKEERKARESALSNKRNTRPVDGLSVESSRCKVRGK